MLEECYDDIHNLTNLTCNDDTLLIHHIQNEISNITQEKGIENLGLNFNSSKPQKEEEKKKRGRKPKYQQIAQVETQVETQIKTEEINDENKTLPIIEAKKRGRKANINSLSKIKLLNLNDTPTIDNTVINLVAHLPLKMTDISSIIQNKTNCEINLNKIIESKPIVVPKYVDLSDTLYDNSSNHTNNNCVCEKCNSYENHINKLENEIKNLKNGIIYNSSNFNKKIYESKVNFYDKGANKWEHQTDIACWWCCHNFDNIPLGIPEFINKDHFYLFGCFCSFNCMMAYNMDLNDYKIWDRQSNIYQMKNRIDPDNKIIIQPAPPRQTLKMFGGPLDISEYRESFFLLNKEYRYFFPPMISIVGLIEEDNRLMNSEIKINKNYNQPYVRRSKPLQNSNNKLLNMISST